MPGVGTLTMNVPTVPAQWAAVQLAPALRVEDAPAQLHPAGGVTSMGIPLQRYGTLNDTCGPARPAPELEISNRSNVSMAVWDSRLPLIEKFAPASGVAVAVGSVVVVGAGADVGGVGVGTGVGS